MGPAGGCPDKEGRGRSSLGREQLCSPNTGNFIHIGWFLGGVLLSELFFREPLQHCICALTWVLYTQTTLEVARPLIETVCVTVLARQRKPLPPPSWLEDFSQKNASLPSRVNKQASKSKLARDVRNSAKPMRNSPPNPLPKYFYSVT